MYTDEELQTLYGNAPQQADAPAQVDVPFKTVKQIANIPSGVADRLASSAVSVLGIPGQFDANDVAAAGNIAPKFDVGPSTGIKDALLNDVAPEIGSWIVPYLGATKVGRAALGTERLAGILTEAGGQGIANAFSSIREGGEGHPLSAGILGTTSGALQAALPRWQRILPLAAVFGLDYLHTGNAFEAGGNLIGNLLPGAYKATSAVVKADPFADLAATLKPFDPALQDTTPAALPALAEHGPAENPNWLYSKEGDRFHIPEGQLDPVPTNPPASPFTDLAPAKEVPLNPVGFPKTSVNELPTSIPDESFPIKDGPVNDAALTFDGQPLQQQEFPLIKLQSERGLAPGTPNFTLPLQGIPAEAGRGTLPLGSKIPAEVPIPTIAAKAPLLLEDAKSAASAVAPKSPESLPSVVTAPKTLSLPARSTVPMPKTVHEPEVQVPESLDFQTANNTQDINELKSLAKKYGMSDNDISIAENEMGVDWMRKWVRDKISNGNNVIASTVPDMPQVMKPDGQFMDIQPRQAGPHIISTVLDEGDGNILAGANWSDTHQKGANSIFNQHIETASGLGESGFLIKDENGIVRVTKDRNEAARIAEAAGQRLPERVGKGPLQSEHLTDPVSSPSPDNPTNIRANERASDTAERDSVEAKLRQNLADAKAKNDGLGTRIAARKLNDFLEATKPIEAEAAQAKAASKAGTNVDLGGKVATEGKDSIARFQARYKNTQGSISPETLALLAVGGAGALVTYQQTKGDVGATIASAAIILGLGALGVRSFSKLSKELGPEAKIALTKTTAIPTAAAKIKQLAIDTSHTPAGLAVGGRAGVWAQANNLMEGLLGVNQTEALKAAKVKADGFIAARVEELRNVFDSVKGYKPSEAFQQAEGRFLRGQLADPQQVQKILNDGGSVLADTFHTLPTANKAAFPEKWMVLDDPNNTNTKGAGIEIWHVSNATKAKLIQAQKDALLTHANSPEDKAYMAFSLKFRDVVDNVMRVYHDALPPGGNKNRLVGTTGQYIARSHAIITDPAAYPSAVEIENAMSRLGILKEGSFLSSVDAQLSPTATHTTAVPWSGSTYYMTPRDALDFKFLHSPESLRGEVRDYIKEIKNRAGLMKLGAIDPDSEQFTSALFTGRKELDEVTQALLGTHKAPYAMMQATLDKILPAGQAATFMKEAVRAVDPMTGLGSALSHTEYNQAIELARKGMQEGDVAAKNRYNELLSYTKAASNDKFGLTSDMFISRGLNERMSGFDASPFGFLDTSIGRGVHNFNSLFKTTHLALSPASIARQFVQAPLMMAMGGVRDIESMVNGFNGYMDRSSAMGKWMNEWGVFSSSAKHGDFNHSLEDVLSGEMDKSIWGKITRQVTKAHGLFAAPDDIVRASVFMSEAKRAAKDLGVPLDSFDPRVAQRAQAFMLRRSMDFSNLPQYVKIGREIPFVNIFLAYTHEIARVAKNMALDAAKGDLQAGVTLAGMATLPFMAQRAAESSLSVEDRAAWDKAQALTPAYSRPRFKLPTGRNKDGSFNYFDITSILPFNDYQMMARSAIHGDMESLVMTNPAVGLDNSPIFNVVGPQIAGKDFHTQRDFRGAGDRIKNAIQQVLPGWTPGIGTEYQKDMPESLGGTLGVTNLKNGRTNTSIGAFLRNATGIDFTQLSPDPLTHNVVAAAKGDIANEKQYLMDVWKSTASDQTKQRALSKFTEAVQQITSELQMKLQLKQGNN